MGQAFLDIVALRSFVRVADCGGFHRAAATLQVSQSAISQHVRRLEKVVGRPLVERQGRQAVFTPDGQLLLEQARRILDVHDDALRKLGSGEPSIVVVGTTEHGADLLLPLITQALAVSHPDHQVRFRIDRTTRLTDAVDSGAIDLAVYMAEAASVPGVPVGVLGLTWYAAPGWTPPSSGGWPVVAIQEPCLLRRRALEALTTMGAEPYVACDSGYVAGVVNAARAGLGVALLANTGHRPEGLVDRDDLPRVAPAALSLRARTGADPDLAVSVVGALRSALRPVRRAAA
jgi:DNA-binding transcriptional LysR family regulator